MLPRLPRRDLPKHLPAAGRRCTRHVSRRKALLCSPTGMFALISTALLELPACEVRWDLKAVKEKNSKLTAELHLNTHTEIAHKIIQAATTTNTRSPCACVSDALLTIPHRHGSAARLLALRLEHRQHLPRDTG